MTKDSLTRIAEMRAQRDALDRDVAAATVEAMGEFLALLSADEITQRLEQLRTAAELLDDGTRNRVEQWLKMHAAMAKLGDLELARLRKLVG